MKIIAYLDAGRTALGVVTSPTHFIAVADVAPDLPSDLIEILEREDGIDRLREATEGRSGDRLLADVTLKPFLHRPNAMWALALNFKSHIAETGLQTNPDYPHLFLRTAASYVGAGEPIVAPPKSVARAFDYEGELAVIIGKPGRYISVERAMEHVAGYTCLNEGSVREYQMHNRQFGLGKNFEASGSYGPWLMTPDEFGDPAWHTVLTRVNGIVRQRAPLDDMLIDVARTISYLSCGYWLRPGDLIAMGTPGALKPQPDDVEGQDLSRQYGPFPTPGLVHMRPGDVVEIEIDGLGVLRNQVFADPA
ncbi:2-keto-4-pentenoate hydratase/2-oxohepta-3-ene-1,7-dioic acid hydratase (catechol pathway) [Burkholderia sp. YR290]|uniref:fumarylacetoacetate hydrolase family protein n=1 Tax=Paraburkholderia hospita TaxID=169430 RepID=UPI00027168AA|nr:fumarylacetoacetate hydrolase family protein [Paraburkholderia hospita]EUC12246.1 fumarylacetoacetate (FAA) hydrolase [Burkholderia sp. BT03]SKC53074.1 2-keto-4-pentenoate hydratase/2-oxohepta-3-ene-1,7-dioic acid hydratase (catechol pathway) [Paraburkholderia hospita]SOE87452.1 2-keto-4-pentenoate hydratase/2-oxohepta-3-ene-1,7-dioic acid hydratase (catechol pathway) [Burkholderia sp. YR290]